MDLIRVVGHLGFKTCLVKNIWATLKLSAKKKAILKCDKFYLKKLTQLLATYFRAKNNNFSKHFRCAFPASDNLNGGPQ